MWFNETVRFTVRRVNQNKNILQEVNQNKKFYTGKTRNDLYYRGGKDLLTLKLINTSFRKSFWHF